MGGVGPAARDEFALTAPSKHESRSNLTSTVGAFDKGYARRAIIAVVGARSTPSSTMPSVQPLLRLAARLFRAPPDTGETMYQVPVYRVRRILTGQLSATFLIMLTLAVLLPSCSGSMCLGVGRIACARADLDHYPRLPERLCGKMYIRVVGAETWKSRRPLARRIIASRQ